VTAARSGGVDEAAAVLAEYRDSGGDLNDVARPVLQAAADAFASGDRKTGLHLSRALARLVTDDARVFSVLGQLAWYAEDWGLAESSFNQVLAIEPDHQEARTYAQRLRFRPVGFTPPHLVLTDDFVIRPIRADDAEDDYRAVMSSVERLKGVFGPGFGEWPEGLTLEEDRAALEWHEAEFGKKTGFVYTVLSRNGDEIIGCIYIYPSRMAGYTAEVIMWVTEKAAERGLDEALDHDVRFWIDDQWPFDSVIYPGRSISWEDFAKSPV
jgi:hypothetical protein